MRSAQFLGEHKEFHTVHSYTLNNNGWHTVDYSWQINTDC